MTTPQCFVFIASSVDGFIARRDGSFDFLKRVERPGEDYGYQPFFDSVDAMIMGRGTYDVVRAFDPWPYAKKRCVVMTHQKYESKHGEEFFAGTPAELLRKLGADGVKRIYVDGGVVISQFLKAGFIDQLTVSQIPIVLGDGLPLFKDTGEHPLTLIESKSFPSGLVRSTWRRE